MKRKWMMQICGVVLLVAIALSAVSIGSVFALTQDQLKANLRDNTALCARLITDSGLQALQQTTQFGMQRITVMDASGKVLFDSDHSDEAQMDNHLTRSEVQAAIAGNPVVVKRHSDTFGCDMYYYAMCSDDGQYIVRLAQRAGNVGHYVGIASALVAAMTLFGLAAAYALARQLSRQVSRQTARLQSNLRMISSGDYHPQPLGDDMEQFGILADMNAVFERIQESYRALGEERARLDSVLSHMTQGVAALDAKQNIVLTNAVARQWFGNVRNGENLIFLLTDPELYRRVMQAVQAQEAATISYRSGDRDWVIQVVPMNREESQQVQTMLLMADVSEQRQMMEQKSMFFAAASHELKTPLTAVQGLSEVLLTKADPARPDYKYLQRIYTESQRLSRIVMDMLYISRLENNDAEVHLQTVVLRDVCEEILAEYRQQCEEKNLQVTLQGDAIYQADLRDIEQCLGNVIGNAVHYNRNGGSIAITLEQDDTQVRVCVQDSGIGIAAEHLPHVCERFYRVDKSRSKQTGNTGLGLAIVKHVVARYHGTLDIDSTLHVGTTVKIVLPRA